MFLFTMLAMRIWVGVVAKGIYIQDWMVMKREYVV
jgi:hypothetical protein